MTPDSHTSTLILAFAYIHGNMFITRISFARQHNFRLRTRERTMLTCLWLCFSPCLLAFIWASFTKNVLYLLDSAGCVSLRMVDDMQHLLAHILFVCCINLWSHSPFAFQATKFCRVSTTVPGGEVMYISAFFLFFAVFIFYPRNCFRTSLNILLLKCKLWSLSTVKLWVWLRSNLRENSIFITF